MTSDAASPREPRLPLRRSLETPEAKRRYVRRLFSTIADRYDLITVLLSYGRDHRWKQRLAAMADIRPGATALDLACGTGDITMELASRGARVVGLDVTHRMIELARAKQPAAPKRPRDGGSTAFLVGDMMALPFPSSSFDIVTTGYGIRNVPELSGALAEIHRVLRSGGLFLSLDFNRPSSAALRLVYLAYLTAVGATLGFMLHGDPDTYRYIPESIRRYPGAAAVCALLRERLRFTECAFEPVLGGLLAIHRARK
jgi:demethylmenaquinone methyltransferase / 2-methoxy-6-polyprenyl-1,4-benzoquinol methylase